MYKRGKEKKEKEFNILVQNLADINIDRINESEFHTMKAEQGIFYMCRYYNDRACGRVIE
jgi:hypothetical protein